jgi:hypothetical protein
VWINLPATRYQEWKAHGVLAVMSPHQAHKALLEKKMKELLEAADRLIVEDLQQNPIMVTEQTLVS